MSRELLIRFVVAPDGTVVPDLAEKLPGRGIWVTASRDLVARAVEKGLFSRAVRGRATAPVDLTDRIEAGLLARVQQTIALTRRAGLAVVGEARVAGALRAGQAALRLEAADGSPGQRRALDRLAPGVPVLCELTGGELGQPFERDRVVHVALRARPLHAGGGLIARLRRETARLAVFRGKSEGAGLENDADLCIEPVTLSPDGNSAVSE